MNNLPAEIALAIVRTADKKDLHAVALINHQFYTVTNPLLWRSLDITNEPKFIKLLQGTLLSQHNLLHYVQRLDISCSTLTNMTLLSFIPLLPPLLQELDFSGDLITDASFSYLPRQCPHLTSLRLAFTPITHQSMVSVGQHCTQLRVLDLFDCESLSPNLFAALAACPLEQMYIYGNPVVDIVDDVTAQKVAQDVVAHFPRLTELALAQIGTDFSYHLFAAMARHDGHAAWPHLTR
ncbi:unnamed protein product [Absidia cylindrospora]